jgi:3-isopropylmalate dehydrogenase
VYDLRRHFDLFCKFAPVRPWPQLARAGRLAHQHVRDVDMLFVRDNIGGVYQGHWQERLAAEGRIVEHTSATAKLFDGSSPSRRAAIGAAADCNGLSKMAVCPGSRLCTRRRCSHARDYDISRPHERRLGGGELIDCIDVLVPNLLNDISSISPACRSSRGVTFSGNFRPDGKVFTRRTTVRATWPAWMWPIRRAGLLSRCCCGNFRLEDGRLVENLTSVWQGG